MATKELQSSFGETENTDQTFGPATSPTTQSAVKVVENDSDLRSKSFPATMFTEDAGQITNTLRSISADGACSNDPPLDMSIHRTPKAAFQDSPHLQVDNTGDNQKSDDKSAQLLATHGMTDHVTKVTQDATEMMSSTNEKKAATNEDVENIVTPSNDGRSLVEDASSGQTALFERRAPSSEIPPRVFRDKRNSLLPSERTSNIISCQEIEGFKNTELRNEQHQSPTEIYSKPNNVYEGGIETSHDENNNVTRNEAKLSSDEHTDKETTNRAYQEEEEADRTDTPKCSDTIGSLVKFPIVQSETHKRRRSSTVSLLQFSSPGEAGGSGFRRVSAESASNVSTPSTSGQSEIPLSQGSSHISAAAAVRRGSRPRRSSIAASMLDSSNATQPRRDSVQAEGKKGSIGFSTLASSLVKWKINSLRAARKTQETIAKDAKHQEFMDRTADRIKTELPRSLLVSIQEEAYPIILRTAQAYRSQLGAKHKLTLQASDRLMELTRDLKTPY